jgi:hypothetical protein
MLLITVSTIAFARQFPSKALVVAEKNPNFQKNLYPFYHNNLSAKVPPVIFLFSAQTRKFAVVDAEDYECLSKYKWQAQRRKTAFYAKRKSNYKAITMHGEILAPPEGMICDHKNHNGLDNHRSNLRLCTQIQNQYNRRATKNSTSKCKVVSWSKGTNKWQASIKANGHSTYLGYFDNQMDAAVAYDRRAGELFGEFACLNFPQLIEFRKWLKQVVRGEKQNGESPIAACMPITSSTDAGSSTEAAL